MRKILCFLVIFLASMSIASAQTMSADAGPSWARLQALPSGVKIHVKSQKQSSNCFFKSANDAELTCANENGGALLMYPRAEVKAVQIRHRGRSTLIGLAIGAGGGAAIGAPLGKSGSFVGHGAAAVIIAIPGAAIGMIVGATTDFAHSTVYKAK